MKNIILTTVLVLVTQTTLATTLNCVEKMANTVTRTQKVDLDLGKRASLFSGDGNTSYITEKKPGFFSMELFMAGREQRLYSEGPISEAAPLILAIWTRDELIEIECSQLVK
ncbi:hypothetical protein CIK05_12025 [Bdellovibrio sp. qaytius]|nr:hypothetical protein CIK05_12025 [Bdellovibrio sp. qaytius]